MNCFREAYVGGPTFLHRYRRYPDVKEIGACQFHGLMPDLIKKCNVHDLHFVDIAVVEKILRCKMGSSSCQGRVPQRRVSPASHPESRRYDFAKQAAPPVKVVCRNFVSLPPVRELVSAWITSGFGTLGD